MNINVTLRLFLHFFIDVSDDWLRFVNFTFNWIRWFQMAIFVHFTYWVVTFRYDLVGLTVWSLDSVRFFTFLSGVIWCVIRWVWCVLTRFFDFLAIFIYVSDDDLTLLRLCWGFLQFVYIRYILITFDNLTSCWVCWLEVTLVIHFTDCVVSCWNQFISLAFECNLLWTVVYDCIVVFVYWLLVFIGYIWLDGLAFCIYIMNINVTLRLSWGFF